MAEVEDRYARQRVLPAIGQQGQERLLGSTVVVIGCGALGSNQAQLLARAGVGRLRLVDRDLVELTNLQRQVLFDEEDAAARAPKAEAAARRLRRVNSSIAIESRVADLTPGNVEALIEGADLVLDGTDNLETRFVLNDACVKRGLRWVYGGAVGTEGMVLVVRPGEGPCLRCLFPEPPPPGSTATCELQGVLNAGPALVAALQVTEALKLLSGNGAPLEGLLAIDLARMLFRTVQVKRDPACPCCVARQFPFLERHEASFATVLCGRNAVQISPSQSPTLSLEQLSQALEAVGRVTRNEHVLRAQIGEHELLVFADGRTVVKGTSDAGVARSLYARYVGT